MELNVRISIDAPKGWRARALTLVVTPVALVAAAALVARAYDTSWVASGQPISATSLKSNLDEIQARLGAIDGQLAMAVPAGTIIAYGGENVPPGWMACDGRMLDGAAPENARLYAAIGTSFGGNAVTQQFKVPDLRGRFVRGWNNLASNDPDAAARAASAPGGASGDHVGSLQDSAVGPHIHHYAASEVTGGTAGGPAGGRLIATTPAGSTFYTSYVPDLTDSMGQPQPYRTETRPTNVALSYLIKL